MSQVIRKSLDLVKRNIDHLFVVFISVLLSTVINYIFTQFSQPLILKINQIGIERNPFSGDYSLALDYTICPEKRWIWDRSTAWVYLVFLVRQPADPELFNLSKVEEFQFALKSNLTDSEIEFNIFINNEYTQYTTSIAISTIWSTYSVRSEDLRPVFRMLPPRPDFRNVYSFGFAAKTSDGIRSERINIDRMVFVYSNGERITFDDFERTTDDLQRFQEINGAVGRWMYGTGSSEN